MTQIASYRLVMDEIHVLLVDHESQDVNNTVRLLETCQYRVTLVEIASEAIKLLSSGKTKFDIIMANINSPDLHGISLLRHAIYVETPIILMATDENTLVAKRVIDYGACLYIKKPATLDMLRLLWQHVAREKMQMMKEKERLTTINYGVQGVKFDERVRRQYSTNMFMMKESEKSQKKISERKRVIREEEYDSDDDTMINDKNKRKGCMEWTEELHKKFVDAIEELGEGRCFPKDIHELMNEPGLTRAQVASHLQKCRTNTWRGPKELKSNSATRHGPSDTSGSLPRAFGSKPRLGKAPSSHLKTTYPNDDEIENMKTQLIMINSSQEPTLDNTKLGTNSSNVEPPPGFEKKFEVPTMDIKGKGILETSKFGIDESKSG